METASPVTDSGPGKRVLIVQSNVMLGQLWQRHLERQGAIVIRVEDGDSAVEVLETQAVNVVVLDLMLDRGHALTVADVAAFRQPRANVIFVTDTSFFSDGSIFSISATARLMLRSETPPEELAAIVAHYAERSVAHLM